MQVNIKRLIDDVQCYETVRNLRWPGMRDCPFCHSISTIKKGNDDSVMNAKIAKGASISHRGLTGETSFLPRVF